MKKVYLIIIIFFSINISKASILVEPYWGYIALGRITQKPNYKYEYEGVEYGGRIGLRVLGLTLGGQYGQSDFTLKLVAPDFALTSEFLAVDYRSKYLGGFLMFNLFSSIRVWGTYFFQTKFKCDGGVNKHDSYNGKGYGGGIGYKLLYFFSLNFEYRRFSLNEYVDRQSGTTTVLTDKWEVSEYLFNISIPMNFFSGGSDDSSDSDSDYESDSDGGDDDYDGGSDGDSDGEDY